MLLRQRSAPIVKPFPGIHYVSVIRLSNLPVALAITAAAVLNWVSALYRWLLLALLNSLLLLARLLREPPCRNRNSHLMLCLLLQTTRFFGNCFSARQHGVMLGSCRSNSHNGACTTSLGVLQRSPPLGRTSPYTKSASISRCGDICFVGNDA